MTALAAAQALWAFVRTPIGGTIALALAGVVALAVWTDRAERRGAAAERARIETKAKEATDAARTGIDDVRRCADAGGVWNRQAGRCR